MTRTSAHWALYTGSDRNGASGTDEVLASGDLVRVVRTDERITGTYAVVVKPSEVYGTGDTYSAWSVLLETLEGWTTEPVGAAL